MMLLNKKIHTILCGLIFMFMILTQSANAQQTEENAILAPFQLCIVKDENYPLDLETALKLALKNNIQVNINQEQVKIDKYDVYAAYSLLLPDVSFTYNQSRFQGGIQIFGNVPFRVYRTVVQPQVTLNYTIFSGGEQIYTILAAKRYEKATKYFLESSKDDLLLSVANSYYDLQRAFQQLEISKKQIDETQAVLELNKKRLEAGLGTILEVSQSEEQVAQSRYNLITANKNILLSTQGLNQLLNLPIDINIIPTDLDIARKQIFTIQDPTPLVEIAIENRDDLKQVKALKDVYLAQRGLARSKFFPKISLQTYFAGAGPRFSDLEQQRFIGYGVTVDFLKNLGVNYIANYKKSGPILRQADLRIEQKLRDIETEITRTLLDVDASDRQILVSNTGLRAAEDTYRYATARLEAGVGTNIDVLSAQTNLTLARSLVVESIINYNKAQVGLLHATGLIDVDKILAKESVTVNNTSNNTTPVQIIPCNAVQLQTYMQNTNTNQLDNNNQSPAENNNVPEYEINVENKSENINNTTQKIITPDQNVIQSTNKDSNATDTPEY